MTAPAKGAAWYEYQKALNEEVETGRGPKPSLDARVTPIETDVTNLKNGTAVEDGVLTEAKLDVNNDPSDTKRLSWNALAGKMEWVTANSSPTDTGEVRMQASDAMGYLETKSLSGAMEFQVFASQIM